jgi:tetrahedral aminopeptidase
MDKNSRTFLESLLTTPSPSGFEEKIQEIVRKRMKPFADSIETDLHGNVLVGLNVDADRRVMLAGHCDQIGLMINYICDKGYIYVTALGGIDIATLWGARVLILGKRGNVEGIIGRKPIHLQEAEERGSVKLKLETIWIDIGVKTKKEAERFIEIGDPIVYRPEIVHLGKDLIAGPGLDDRVGLFVAMEALILCVKKKLNVALYAVSTVQEEVGLRGAQTAAYSIDPEIGIAIDVTHATDNPGAGSKRTECIIGGGPCISKGPNTNPVVQRLLEAAAKKSKIKFQLEPSPRPLGNDANVIQVSKQGVATASIGIPNRYMHSQVEVCSLSDLENAAKLLAQFVSSINDKSDFKPR